MHDVTGASDHRVQRVVTADVGVRELDGALLGEAVGLMNGGVDVDRDRTVTGPGATLPGPPQCFTGDFVELAGVSPREGTQERAERGRGPQAVSEHYTGGPGP